MSGTVRDVQAGVDALLRPRSVAVIGASSGGAASGNFALRNVLASSAQVRVHVVHPRASQVEGVQAVPTVRHLPERIDVALVSLPAPAVLEVLEELAAAGCASAIVPTSGFTSRETGDLQRFVASSPMAVHGPNCMGVINVSDGLPLWFYEDQLTTQRRGAVALVSQSGSAVFVSRATESLGFSKIVSTGNETGLTTADYLRWLSDDPETSAIGLVLESIRDVDAFTDAVRCCRDAGKPVVALKVGRTALGSRATMAHTGALTGKDAAYTALFSQLDVPLLRDYDELAGALECLAVPALPRADGRRVAVLTDSGGEAGLAADLSARHDIELPQFTAGTVLRLEAAAPGTQAHNPLDIGASPTAGDDFYATAYGLALADPNIDALMVVMEAHHGLTAGETEYSTELCAALRELAESDPGKPIVAVSSSSTATSPQIRAWLGDRVPLLRGISNGFAALGALTGNRRPVAGAPARPARLPDLSDVAVLRSMLASTRGAVGLPLARELLGLYGLPLVASTLAGTAEEATRWAQGRFPVVVKVASADIAHRSELGGVVVGVDDEAALVEAIARIRSNVTAKVPSATVDGYEVQEQVERGVEAVLGFTADPVFGATITVGTGGALVELEADVATTLAPVSRAQAHALITQTRLGSVLSGYRNLVEPTDLTALAEAVESLSWLAADFGDMLAEGDLNPAIVKPGTGQVRVVDVLLIAAGSAVPAQPVPHDAATPPSGRALPVEVGSEAAS